MGHRARRLPSLRLRPHARRALLALCLLPAAAVAGERITAASYSDPTTRYAHGVLGDDIEHGSLLLTFASGETRRHRLPNTMVFEDTAPRLADLDGDGRPEVITVESDTTSGARLAIYGAGGRLVATPFIGTRYRWLAPLGAADLDGDGAVEVAYVDRPHLARILRIWRYDNGALEEIAQVGGVTNHRIGERDIAGGIRRCAGPPEMILADAGWHSLLALRLHRDGSVTQRRIGTDISRAAFARSMACQN